MENTNSALQQFEAFAKEQLRNHQAELNTRYQNTELGQSTLNEAYNTHQKMYKEELDEKIKQLTASSGNEELTSELQEHKETYVSQLTR